MTKRTFTVTRREARKTLLEWFHERFSLSWKQARDWIKEGGVTLNATVCRDPRRRLEPGQKIEVPMDSSPEPEKKKESKRRRIPDPVIRYVDDHIAVVDKPAGMTTVRSAEDIAEQGSRAKGYLPKTVADVLPGLLACQSRQLRAVHRLDKETTGLLVFALTPEAEEHLNQQFRAHTVERVYMALVRGRARPGRFESILVKDRGDGRRGSSPDAKDGQRAVTYVKLVEDLGDYSLVECRLETGRTHQVRIHLGEAGTPLCGERIYERSLRGRPLPDHSRAERPALHAATLGFVHPSSGEKVHWTSPLPDDLSVMIDRFRHYKKRNRKQ